MLKDLIPDIAGGPNDYLKTCNIMTYELGRMIRGLVYMQYSQLSKNELDERIRNKEARIELADLITQCHVIAEQMDWEWKGLEYDGEERFRERMVELKEGRL